MLKLKFVKNRKVNNYQVLKFNKQYTNPRLKRSKSNPRLNARISCLVIAENNMYSFAKKAKNKLGYLNYWNCCNR